MRRLILAALLAGVVTGAQAADMPDIPILRGPVSEGLMSARPVYWQGIYAGGQFAWGSVSTDHASTVGGVNSIALAAATPLLNAGNFARPAPPVLGQASVNHSGYGVFMGYNSQWEDVVIGLEGNYTHGNFASGNTGTSVSFANITGPTQSTFTSSSLFQLDNYGTIRGRAGYAIGSFLPYGFVGAAFGMADFYRSATITAGPAGGAPVFSVTRNADVPSHFVYGYTVGAGLDVMLIGGLFARAEFEHTRITSQLNVSLNTVRGGLGYKF